MNEWMNEWIKNGWKKKERTTEVMAWKNATQIEINELLRCKVQFPLCYISLLIRKQVRTEKTQLSPLGIRLAFDRFLEPLHGTISKC